MVAVLVGLALPASAGAYVYWDSSAGLNQLIGRADLDGGGINPTLVTDGQGQTPIAVDATHIYHLTIPSSGPQAGEPQEVYANLDGTGETPLPAGVGGTDSNGVSAVDSGHIYWGDGNGDIGRADLDGAHADPTFLTGIGAAPANGGYAVYGNYIYWADYNQGFGQYIGRADLTSKAVDDTFVQLPTNTGGAGGPHGIAVDDQGVFWTTSPGGTNPPANSIGHASLLGGDISDNFIPGAVVDHGSGIAIVGQTLYFESYDTLAAKFTIARANFALSGTSNGVTVDTDFITLDGNGYEWLAANSVTPAPTPTPTPTPPGPTAPAPTTPMTTSAAPAPPPPPPPPTQLSVASGATQGNDGSLTLTIAVSGPGTVTAQDASALSSARSAVGRTVKATPKRKPKPLIQPAHKSLTKAGKVRLILKPTAAANTLLKKKHKITVRVRITFAPTGLPTAKAKSKTVTVSLRPRHKTHT